MYIGPRILRCVSDRIPQEFFVGHSDTPKDTYENARKRTEASRTEYYHKLGRAMFGLAVPGLGYDCFRYVTLAVLYINVQ